MIGFNMFILRTYKSNKNFEELNVIFLNLRCIKIKFFFYLNSTSQFYDVYKARLYDNVYQ